MLSDKRYCPYCTFEHFIVHEECVEATLAALEAENEGYAQLLGSANNDVARLTEYADTLEARVQRLTEAGDLVLDAFVAETAEQATAIAGLSYAMLEALDA